MTIRPMGCRNPEDVSGENARRAEMEDGIRNEVDAFRVQGGNPRLDEAIAVRVLARRITDYLADKYGVLEEPKNPGSGFKAAGIFFQLRLKAMNAGDMETVKQLDELRDEICGIGKAGWGR